MGQKPQAPPEIKKILSDVDMLIAELDKSIKQKKKSPVEKTSQLEPPGQSGGGKSGQQSQQGQNQGSEKQSSNGQASGDQSGSQSQSKSGQSNTQPQAGMQAPGQENVWQQANKGLKSIHQSWNKLEPAAIKAGLPVKARDDFEKALEELTVSLGGQKSQESLMAAVSLYKYFSQIIQVFAMATPPDFYQVKYEALSAITEAGKDNWPAARQHLPMIQEHWNNLKIQAPDADPKLLNQTEFSINDLRDAISSEQSDLVAIKGEIAMNNLKQLESELSKMSSGQGGGQKHK